MNARKVVFYTSVALSILATAFIFTSREPENLASEVENKTLAPQTSSEATEAEKKELHSPSDGAELEQGSQNEFKGVASELSKYPGFAGNEEEEEIFSQEELARENYIASCMQTRGYQYLPAPSIVVSEADIGDPEGFERLLQEAAQDPNESYINALSSEEKKDYYTALTGMENPNDPEGQSQELAAFSDSCVNRAFEKIPGIFAKRNALIEALDSMELTMAEDQRIAAATEKWSSCMATYGYRYQRPGMVYESADRALVEAELNSGNEAMQQITQEQWQQSLAALEECQQRTQLRQIQRQVRVEYENAFVQTLRDQLGAPNY